MARNKRPRTGISSPEPDRNANGSEFGAGGRINPTNPPQKGVTSEPPVDPRQAIIRSDPYTEYVASSTQYAFIRADVALAPTIDQAEKINGWRIWDDMVLDPTAAGLQLWTKVNTLCDGLQINAKLFEPAMGEEQPDQADVALAEWARRYIVEIIDRLQYTDRPFMAILWDLMDGVRLPHKLAEITYETLKSGDFKGNPGFKHIAPKPYANYSLVFDTMNRLRGIIGKVPGGSQAKWTGLIFDASQVPNCIAAEKLMFFYATDQDGLPSSLWSGVYAPWARLQIQYIQYMNAIVMMAGGKTSAVLGDEQKAQQFLSKQGGTVQTALDVTWNALNNWGNVGAAAFLPGTVPQVWWPPGSVLDGFIKAILQSQREMALALTTNTKGLVEGEHGSGLGQETASDDVLPVIRFLKQRVCWLVNRMMYHALTVAKGEEFAMRYCPVASMEAADEQDFAVNATAGAPMLTNKTVFPSQLDEFFSKFGIKPPTKAEKDQYAIGWALMYDMLQPALNNAKNPPKPEVPTRGNDK